MSKPDEQKPIIIDSRAWTGDVEEAYAPHVNRVERITLGKNGILMIFGGGAFLLLVWERWATEWASWSRVALVSCISLLLIGGGIRLIAGASREPKRKG